MSERDAYYPPTISAVVSEYTQHAWLGVIITPSTDIPTRRKSKRIERVFMHPDSAFEWCETEIAALSVELVLLANKEDL